MRAGFRWALLASVGASVALLLWPEASVEVVNVAAPPAPAAPVAQTTPRTPRPAPERGGPRAPAPWPLPEPDALAAWSGPLPSVEPLHAPVRPQAAAPASPPPVVVAAAASAASDALPTPPAFPYRWIGRLQDPAGGQAFLAGPQATLSVKAGDLVDRQWRVERIGDQQLDLVWLPTGSLVQVRL